MKPTTQYMAYEFLMAFTMVGTGVNLANNQFILAALYGLVGLFSYNQALMLGKQIDIVPFYYRWLNKKKKEKELEEFL